MSKYTTEVRFICETCADLNESVDYNKVNEIINKSIPKIFDFEFPIFDENYRNVLCNKILKHYYTREIGFETVGLWKLKLDTKLNEIMPYYNQLYASELIKFNPLDNVNITKSYKLKTDKGTKSDSTSNGSQNVKSSDEDKFSRTPMGALTDVKDNKYLTEVRIVDSDRNGTSNSNIVFNENVSNIDDYIETITGKNDMGSMSKYLKEFRETFLNIDLMIIEELENLFFGLW